MTDESQKAEMYALFVKLKCIGSSTSSYIMFITQRTLKYKNETSAC